MLVGRAAAAMRAAYAATASPTLALQTPRGISDNRALPLAAVRTHRVPDTMGVPDIPVGRGLRTPIALSYPGVSPAHVSV